MKYLLPLILGCLLLCSCGGAKPLEETTPKFPTDGFFGEVSASKEAGGTVQSILLNLPRLRGLRVLEDRLLLFSGEHSTTLTLLDPETLAQIAQLELEFFLDPADPSLRFHGDGTLSFFDPHRLETLILDSCLVPQRQIPAPGALSGHPILWENILYYCTGSDIRGWDLETGIRRRITEMTFDTQVLTDVLLDGSVLQCQASEAGNTQTLFFAARDGRLLHRGAGIYSLQTRKGRFYASVPAGHSRIHVFGGETPSMLVPEEPEANLFFLPDRQAALTASSREDNILLRYYDLTSGHCSHTLTLEGAQAPLAAAAFREQLAILTAAAHDQGVLTLWTPREHRPGTDQDAASYTVPYRRAENPDREGLHACQQQAAALGEKYGIRILLGEEAAACRPWDHTLEAEHLVPVLQQELDLLEQQLGQYPVELLKQTAAHFTSLNLCLVRSVAGTGSGSSLDLPTGAQFLLGRDAYVVIAAGPQSRQALHHELFHLMEIHILSTSTAFDHWDQRNPAGFQYDYDYTANARRDSGVYLLHENRAFVDTYSMSFPKEDRARIFEYAMLEDQKELFLFPRMQEKLKALCTGIRDAYGLEKSQETFPWEQHLT